MLLSYDFPYSSYKGLIKKHHISSFSPSSIYSHLTSNKHLQPPYWSGINLFLCKLNWLLTAVFTHFTFNADFCHIYVFLTMSLQRRLHCFHLHTNASLYPEFTTSWFFKQVLSLHRNVTEQVGDFIDSTVSCQSSVIFYHWHLSG